jgi:hypothetical protein
MMRTTAITCTTANRSPSRELDYIICIFIVLLDNSCSTTATARQDHLAHHYHHQQASTNTSTNILCSQQTTLPAQPVRIMLHCMMLAWAWAVGHQLSRNLPNLPLHPTAGLNCCLLGCAHVATPSSNNYALPTSAYSTIRLAAVGRSCQRAKQPSASLRKALTAAPI